MSVRIRLETLEDRSVPATFGLPWHDPRHLTLSFAPDGTAIAAHSSDLHAALGSQSSPAAWQRTVLEAFQSWAAVADLDFGVVADGGLAFGTPGLAQGDPRFGDVRVGAHPMSPEVLAVAVPPDPALSGSWSGDVLLNSSYRFIGQPYSLKAVVMHEAGHALGLGNSGDPNSVMFTTYSTGTQTLSAEDVARIQALYGVRSPDRYEGTRGNDRRGLASALLAPAGFKGETPLVAFGDVSTTADVDFFSFRSPPDGNDDAFDRSVTVRLQTSGVSLLTPKVVVLDAAGRVLRRASSTSLTGDTLQFRLDGLSSQQTYYVRVEGASDDVFGVGRYGLSVRFDKTSSVSDEVVAAMLSGPHSGLSAEQIDAYFRNGGDVLFDGEYGGNDTTATAPRLTATPGRGGARYEHVSSLSKKEDVDYFAVTAPAAGGVLTATVWTSSEKDFRPQVSVVDAAGRSVAAEVLANGDGTSTVQASGLTAGATYYVRVGQSPTAGEDKGNYHVAATFGAVASEVRTFGEGTLGVSDLDDASRLYVAQTQLFHFVLTAGGQDAGATVRVRVVDAGGSEVYAATARSGESASEGAVLLTPGAYTVLIEIDNPNGSPVSYVLRGASLSNPIGPVPIDPTTAPQYVSPVSPGTYLYPGFTVPYSPTALPGYFDPRDPATWAAGFVPPQDALAYPWMLSSPEPYYWVPSNL